MAFVVLCVSFRPGSLLDDTTVLHLNISLTYCHLNLRNAEINLLKNVSYYQAVIFAV